ncbi:MAG: pyridoxal phosphate-dependent aminotransferase [Bacteroidales bacterium]|jgi:aspartate aminotransferase|nr:pyridoxal phosphate-dependent aminotransferase [Bacteroidales bacterium]MDY0333730.1 pyridoxal phosphate-dependent aminotransferase [Bacteroidales bacterium]NLO51210.1 pyridoxal phosphate-dependent aminotransferase [Bacteroidales bacterium]
MSKQNEKINVSLNLNVRNLGTSATLAINERSNRLIREGKRVIKFGLGQSPFPVPPQVVESLQKNAFQKDYLPVRGLYKLRETIARFNQKAHGLQCTADDVIIGPGSKELIFLLQMVYYGDLVIPTPSWVSYSPQAQIIGRPVTWVPTFEEDNWMLTPEKLDIICRADPGRPRIVILNYPNNPTGATYTLHRLKEIAAIARRHKVILISDEIYGLLHHKGQHVSISRFYPEGTIISSGLSKWCGAGGWRLGTFTFPPSLRELLDAMAAVASETYTATSAPIQYAAITAFEGSPEIDEYLRLSRKILHAIALAMVKRLRRAFVRVPDPEGGFYLFPNFEFYKQKLIEHDIYTSVELCNRLLADTGVAMLSGRDFGRQPEELTVRMAYVDFDGAKALEEAAKLSRTKEITETFLKKYCPNMIDGTNLICDWLKKL